jgi:hypothetical protein
MAQADAGGLAMAVPAGLAPVDGLAEGVADGLDVGLTDGVGVGVGSVHGRVTDRHTCW